MANMRTAMISVLFIVVAVIYGVITRGRKIPAAANIVSAIWPSSWPSWPSATILPVIALDNTTWMILVGLYILVASVAPVWILLAAARLPVELSALRHDRPGARRHHRRRRHGRRRLAGHSRVHRLFRCGWRHPRWLPRAFCSRRCSSPSPAAPSPASTASWPRALPPSSSTARPRRSPSPTAACCWSAWLPSSRCARWPSCSPAIWTAPTPRRPRSSRRASPRCSPACRGWRARSPSLTRCSCWRCRCSA